MDAINQMIANNFYGMKVENFQAKVFGRPDLPRMPYIRSSDAVFDHYSQILEDKFNLKRYYAIIRCKSCGARHPITTDDLRFETVPDSVFGERYEIYVPCRYCKSRNTEFIDGVWEDLKKIMVRNLVRWTELNVIECERCGLIGVSTPVYVNHTVSYTPCPWCGSIDTKLCNTEGS